MENDFAKIEKLQNVSGWVTWKFQIRQVLESFDLFDVTTGIDVRPTSNDQASYAEKLAAWRKLDAKARRYISTSLGKELLLHVLNCETANDMWKALKNVYEPSSSSSILLLQQRYMSFAKDPADDMATFLSKLFDIVYQLKENKENLSDSMVMTKIQMSLPAEYNHFHSAWDSVAESSRTLENMKSRLIIEETRLKAYVKEENVEALFMKKKETGAKKKFRRKKSDNNGGCFKCGSSDHWQKDCTQSKKAGNSNAKHGEALMCNSSHGSSDDDSQIWWKDSGATDHMSKRLDWFVNFEKKEYSRVKIGNGTYIQAEGHGDINILVFVGEN